jgi:hypothetical protein
MTRGPPEHFQYRLQPLGTVRDLPQGQYDRKIMKMDGLERTIIHAYVEEDWDNKG